MWINNLVPNIEHLAASPFRSRSLIFRLGTQSGHKNAAGNLLL